MSPHLAPFLLAMVVKTQPLGFLNDCWPVKGVPCGAITVLGQMGILAVDPQSVLGGAGAEPGSSCIWMALSCLQSKLPGILFK